MAQNVRYALDRRGLCHLRQRIAHHFAHHELTQILPLQREVQDLIFIDRADRQTLFKHGNLRNILFLHGFQCVKNSLIGTRHHQFAHFAARVLCFHHFRRGDVHHRIDVAALAHPFIVIHFAEIPHARVRQQRDNKIVRPKVFRQTQSPGEASAARTSSEEAFHLGQPTRDHETLFVIHLDDVVENFQIHRRGEKIFADPFHNVCLRLNRCARFHEIVVQRTVGIDSNNLHRGILLFQVFSCATDRPTRAQAAHKMRDLAFTILPNLRPSAEIVRLRIHGIVILVRIVGIGNLAREFLRYGVVAPRVLRLHSRRANNHFCAKRLEQIHLFLRLFVRRCEHAFVAAHRRHQRQSHAGISGSAFNDCAARLEQAALFRVVDHRQADAVFHRAAGIREFRFHVNLRLQVLGDAVQAHQGRVPNRFQNVVALHLFLDFSAEVFSV